MAVTSLIKPIQNKKGIFYNFQSALEDINLTLSNTENDVRFSKFVLLRLPNIGTPDNLETDNKIQFLSPGETPLIEGLSTDNNVNLAESFQNYALNMEAIMIGLPSYNREEKLTISERIFWKWVKELGAVRFQDANNLEKNVNALGAEKRFVEKSETKSTYKRVVKYVADIDVVNSLKSNENSYTEVYIHVPQNVGSTPHVLFKSYSDENYKPNMVITNNPPDPLNIEYLSGRKYTETHPFGLSMLGFYDLDDQSVYTEIRDTFTGIPAPGNWFNKTINNSYYTDSVSGVYDIAKDQYITKQKGITTVNYTRSTLDGIMLDFDLTNYKLASENPEIKVFSQFNDYVANKDFEFNAILIYYDTYDPNNLDVNGNPVDFKTNLYGILFLDKVQQDGLEFAIPRITKFKPDPLNLIQGNAFAHKLNLKLDTSIEDTKVEKSINDYSTFSLDLFVDVLTKFKQIQTTLNNKLLELDQLRQDVETVKDLLINTEDKNEIDIRLTNLEKSLQENQAIFNNTGEVMQMIENVNVKLDNIVTGQSNISISYDIDAVRPGEGIAIDRRTPNRIRVLNINQNYNISNDSITNIFANNLITLGTFSNYIRHEDGGSQIVLTRDLEIFIDDSVITWKKGQTVRLIIADEINPDIYDIKIKTDALNRRNTGAYGVSIGVLDYIDFSSNDFNNKPIFDITCVDDFLLTFRIDKIR